MDYKGLRRLRQVQLARIVGVSPAAITKWAHRGCPRNDDRTYDLAAVVGWIREGGVDVSRLPQEVTRGIVGVSRPTMSAWTRRGCPRNEDRTYDLGAVVGWRLDELKRQLDEQRAAAASARARREESAAAMAEMDLAERRGDLVPRAAMVAGWCARYQTVKSMLLAMVRGLRQRKAPAELVEWVEGYLARMLTQLAAGQVALKLPRRIAKLLEGDGE